MTRPQDIVSDEEIIRVHANANFGPTMTPREVVNDGVRKYSVGYHCGHTQMTILHEHGLITKPRPGRAGPSLTEKGKRYARTIVQDVAVVEAERVLDAVALYLTEQYGASYGMDHPVDRQRVLHRLGLAERPSEQTRPPTESASARSRAHLEGVARAILKGFGRSRVIYEAEARTILKLLEETRESRASRRAGAEFLAMLRLFGPCTFNGRTITADQLEREIGRD